MAPLPLSLFDYALPAERIAQHPAEPRDASRLLVLPRAGGELCHQGFCDLPGLLEPGDLLVVNRTRVIPARLAAQRAGGGRAEILFVRPLDGPLEAARRWQALGNPAKGFRPGKALQGPEGLTLEVVRRERGLVELLADRPVWPLLETHGQVPLPPYIERGEEGDPRDCLDYQTLFARERGAVAAPTASLHFTEGVLAALAERGIERTEVLLHVGPGTFLPVRDDHAEDVRGHPMHGEWYHIPPASAETIRRTRREGGRIIAVGTTVVRALESWAATCRADGETTLFIYPGYRFRVADGMVTNFHLPRSTLLMLVSAFAGRDRVLAAYEEAIREEYRFYSYGDAMLML